MINFLQQDEVGGEVIHLTLSEDSDVHDTFRVFVSFLKAMTYSDSTIYHGILTAQQEMEESLEVNYKTYKNEVLLDG